jgi:hypothetical protein
MMSQEIAKNSWNAHDCTSSAARTTNSRPIAPTQARRLTGARHLSNLDPNQMSHHFEQLSTPEIEAIASAAAAVLQERRSVRTEHGNAATQLTSATTSGRQDNAARAAQQRRRERPLKTAELELQLAELPFSAVFAPKACETSDPSSGEETESSAPLLLPALRSCVGTWSVPPKNRTWREILVSFAGSYLGLLAVCAVTMELLPFLSDGGKNSLALFSPKPFAVGSFGACAVLVFNAHKAPLSQVKNVIVGNTLSALVGVALRNLMLATAAPVLYVAPLAVAAAVLCMDLLDAVHPPGGAAALIAVCGGPAVEALGYWYVAVQFVGVSLLFGISRLTNSFAV